MSNIVDMLMDNDENLYEIDAINRFCDAREALLFDNDENEARRILGLGDGIDVWKELLD